MKLLSAIIVAVFLGLAGCAGGGGGEGDSGGTTGNTDGSSPINADEEIEYRKALTRCYKTGGSRIVKINNYLHCY